jgi:hypothetical protein
MIRVGELGWYYKPDIPDVPDVPPPKCDFLINLDRMHHSLIAHFQDLSKDDTLVMVCVLDNPLVKHLMPFFSMLRHPQEARE